MVKRQPKGSKRGGQFVSDRRGVVAPSVASGVVSARAAVQDLQTVDDLALFTSDVTDVGFQRLSKLIKERQRALYPVSEGSGGSLVEAEADLVKLQARFLVASDFRASELGYGVDGGAEVSSEALRLRLQYKLAMLGLLGD